MVSFFSISLAYQQPDDMYATPSIRSKASGANTALTRAASQGDHRLVQHLLDNGAGVNGCNPRTKSTALHYAASRGHTACCRVLVEWGANVNAFDADMNMPLHLAAQYGNIDVVRLLLRNGAERELATSYGVTALQLAKSNGHSECVKLLAPPSPQAVLPPIRPSASAPTTQTRDFARFQADLRKMQSYQKVSQWLEELAKHDMLDPPATTTTIAPPPPPPPPRRCLSRTSRSSSSRSARGGVPSLGQRPRTAQVNMSTLTLDSSILGADVRARPSERLSFRPAMKLSRSAPAPAAPPAPPLRCT
ncbi:serine/threonine-protein phosphatase 6 regulatory ankyrin repeat subunit B-like [Oscarella lobularis]|uniref:serine/threonine-protein phosphatase 6 regulatory ankyrin repeat subunit B-like n=1 Tax=Oscarella lobularis TaxID=121494 RepID=UPI003313D21A